MATKSTFRRLSIALVDERGDRALAIPAANAGPISGLTGLGLCPAAAVSHPFTSWTDYSSYELAPNGGFESGSAGWSLADGAQVVSGNESFYANGAGDSHSLALPAGGSATSGAVCVGGLTRSTIRFFASGGSAAGCGRRPDPVSRTHRRAAREARRRLVAVAPGWQPTPVLLALELPLGTSSVQIALTSASGTVLVDDVYVDPWLTN